MYKLVSELCNDKPQFLTNDGQEVVIFPWINRPENKTISVDYHLLADVRSNVCPLVNGLNPYVKDNRIDIDDYSSIGNLGRVLYEIHGNVMFITGVFVHPRMRGKGYMKHLIAMTYKDVSAEEPIDYIVLSPKKHPSSPMSTDTLRAVYKSIDFVSVGSWCDTIGMPRPNNKVVYSHYHHLEQKKIRKEGNDTMIVCVGESVPRVRIEEAWEQVMNIMPALVSEWTVW
jgi:hypothetical protein